MRNQFSDFGKSGVPKRIEVLDKNIKTILKIGRHIALLYAYFNTYSILLDDKCAQFKNSKYCFLADYYVPLSKRWYIMLILLLQLYSMTITVYVTTGTLIVMYYSLELLIVRIEILKEVIGNITLTRNKKRNFKKLQPVVVYHQEIFRMFQFISDFTTRFLVSTKIYGIISLTMATTHFTLKNDLTSLSVIILNLFGLFLYHTFGQRFTAAAGSVADAVYNMNWFDADVSTRKDVLILLCLSQKELKTELPLFGDLSHAAAMNEYKKSYVFFNWVLQVTKQRNI
nr:putative odorant receptor 85d [Onthophagus taurus]